VIGEVNGALRELLAARLPGSSEVRFGPPPSSPPSGSVLSVFLAQVRPDPQAVGGADWEDVRNEHGLVIGRRPPTRRFELTYLITAWAKDADREAELVDAVLTAINPNSRIDPDSLPGSLKGTQVTFRFEGDAAASYAQLDLPPRTVLGIVVNAPLVQPMDTDLEKPAARITLGVDRTPGPDGFAPPPPSPRERRRWNNKRIHEEEPPGGADPGRRQAH